MKRIRTARELYCEILKSFYFGVYRKDSKFMTYKEAHETYGLAKNTISTAYGMLQQEGFIRTDGANGTIVTFDLNNPKHVAKVPIEWPSTESQDSIPYRVAMRLHAQSLYTGLTRSTEEQLEESKELVTDILRHVQSEKPYHEQVFAFWTYVVSSLDNKFMSRVSDHFISRYLYLLPPTHLSAEQQHLISKSAVEYYEYLLECLEHHDFEEFPAQFEAHYNNYYQYGGVVFSKLEDEEIFKEQALYGRLLEDICIKIMSRELQKGDSLPTTKHLCTLYGVSAKTVNRTYGILTEMGFISRRVRSGTKLIAEPDDPEIWERLEEAAGFQQCEWKDTVEALAIINSALSRGAVITPDIVNEMQEELARQRRMFELHGTPYFVTDVLISPLVANLQPGILHKYYAQLTDVMNRARTLCTFRVRGNEEHRKEIYQLMCRALEALERGEQAAFSVLSGHAVLRNAELLIGDYMKATRGTGSGDSQPVKNDLI